MAHFAEIDEDNKVLRVLVFDNNDVDANGGDQSEQAAEFIQTSFGNSENGVKWVQTSYNNSMRKQFAGVGFTYDDVNDIFIAPQPFPSWSLDDNFDWQAPIPMPEDDNLYTWNEETQSWDIIETE